MKSKQKLLAEKRLYNAASRYLDEAVLYTKDGKAVYIPDDVYNSSFAKPEEDIATGEDDKVADLAFNSKAYDDAVKTAAKNAAKAKYADSFSKRVEAGQAIYDQLNAAVLKSVEDFARDMIKEGAIAYDEDEGEWVIGQDDPKTIRMILKQLEATVYFDVIKPAKARLTNAQQIALLAAFHKAFSNPNHVKDGTPAFKGCKKLLKAAVNKIGKKDIEVNSEELPEAFCHAVNKVLTEMYAKRYNVRLSEAKKMFIVNDTKIVL